MIKDYPSPFCIEKFAVRFRSGNTRWDRLLLSLAGKVNSFFHGVASYVCFCRKHQCLHDCTFSQIGTCKNEKDCDMCLSYMVQNPGQTSVTQGEMGLG